VCVCVCVDASVCETRHRFGAQILWHLWILSKEPFILLKEPCMQTWSQQKSPIFSQKNSTYEYRVTAETAQIWRANSRAACGYVAWSAGVLECTAVLSLYIRLFRRKETYIIGLFRFSGCMRPCRSFWMCDGLQGSFEFTHVSFGEKRHTIKGSLNSRAAHGHVARSRWVLDCRVLSNLHMSQEERDTRVKRHRFAVDGNYVSLGGKRHDYRAL